MYNSQRGLDSSPKKIGTWIVGGIAATFLTIGAFGSFYTVDEGERAVVKKYGEVVHVTGPGLNFKLPIVNSVEYVSVQSFVRRYGFGQPDVPTPLQAYSQDLQVGDLIVSVNLTPNSDPVAVREVISQYGSVEGYLRREFDPKVPQSVKSSFARYTAQSSNENQVELASAIMASLKSLIPSTIATVQSVQVEDISFSDRFEAAMEDRKMNEIAVEKQIQENLKQAEVNKQTVATAEAANLAQKAVSDAEAYRITSEAQAKSEAVKLLGDAEASAIQAKADALAKNAELVDLIKAERWDGALPTSMIPGTAVPFLNVE